MRPFLINKYILPHRFQYNNTLIAPYFIFFEKNACIYSQVVILYFGTNKYALVAQLDRVTGYEPVGQGFESLQARHVKDVPFSGTSFIFV